MKIEHPIEPVWDKASKILILGSFPSVKSREYGFFYGHKQNRFWKVIARICGEELPESIEEKKALLLKNHIALWDVIASCEITGSADSSIKNVTPNNLNEIIGESDIRAIFTNGKTADKLYHKYNKNSIITLCLPSTSPANAAWSEDRLYEYWNARISNYL